MSATAMASVDRRRSSVEHSLLEQRFWSYFQLSGSLLSGSLLAGSVCSLVADQRNPPPPPDQAARTSQKPQRRPPPQTQQLDAQHQHEPRTSRDGIPAE